jgi:hypothetical protein
MAGKIAGMKRVLSFKVDPEVRRLVECMAAQQTLDGGKRCTLTEVIEQAIRELAKRMGMKA